MGVQSSGGMFFGGVAEQLAGRAPWAETVN